MTKKDFLYGLKASLYGRVDTAVITESINYYEDYINTQVRMGRSEADVVKELGDPRLIARSIADVNKQAGAEQTKESAYQNNRGYAQGGNAQNVYGQNIYGEEDRFRKKRFRMPGWLVLCLVMVVFFLIITAAFSLLSFLAPILLPLLFIGMIVKVLRST